MAATWKPAARDKARAPSSSFAFRWLPSYPSGQPRTTTANARAHTGAFRILVADDNRDAAESMSSVLRLMGNEVRTVNDGVQAVEEAAAFRPDMVLLDIGMPRLNGYDAARRIRAERWGKNIVVVALTGWGQEEDKRLALEAGFDRHFTKPVDPADLERLIAGLRSRSLPGLAGAGPDTLRLEFVSPYGRRRMATSSPRVGTSSAFFCVGICTAAASVLATFAACEPWARAYTQVNSAPSRKIWAE